MAGRAGLALACLCLVSSAQAGEEAIPGLRVIGSTIHILDGRGHNAGILKEEAPGRWIWMDMRGDAVRRMQTPPGCIPFMPCAGPRRSSD